ncbi:hypothetical protein [Nocardioides panaciterrulae]|uniref:Uncharacterized protein n=1 Tax=Nocardioides panaciterrulae TaxID=661492 RepID=A0A7Y9E456_9ACTN|nr:hypothetical protein [Nocardioides panaciterrulae]NYD40625.1 hypothetical protein [Nocardioides panaciterrulae]
MNLSTRWLAVLGASAALALGAAPSALADTGTAAASTSTGAAATSGTDTTPSPAQADSIAARFGIEASLAHGALARAINPGDYQCASTDLDAYVGSLINGFSDTEWNFLIRHTEMLDIPTYDALLHGSDTDPRYALRPDYRQSLTQTFRDVKRFWDINSSDIELHAMHGSVMQDPERVARVYREVYGLSPTAAAARAQDVANAVSTGFDGGDNPLFTLNAFAFTAQGDPDPLVQGVPDKLIFGDGILDALQAMGIGDVGPRAVMGHEFGHHVQYEDNLFDSPLTGAEATRRTELMADAFGTYFATHARGLALNTKRVLQVEKSFYEVGDCYYTDPGHHGTPNQRLRASTWAADVANAARPQGKILPSLTFADMFEKELPAIVAPDAG